MENTKLENLIAISDNFEFEGKGLVKDVKTDEVFEMTITFKTNDFVANPYTDTFRTYVSENVEVHLKKQENIDKVSDLEIVENQVIKSLKKGLNSNALNAIKTLYTLVDNKELVLSDNFYESTLELINVLKQAFVDENHTFSLFSQLLEIEYVLEDVKELSDIYARSGINKAVKPPIGELRALAKEYTHESNNFGLD